MNIPIQYKHLPKVKGEREEIILVTNYKEKIAGTTLEIPIMEIGGKPHGFVSDGGTIPSFLWWILKMTPFGRFLRCFLRHDYRLAFRYLLNTDFTECNKQLAEEMKALGASERQCKWVYRGVQYAGRILWFKGFNHANDYSYHYAEIKEDV